MPQFVIAVSIFSFFQVGKGLVWRRRVEQWCQATTWVHSAHTHIGIRITGY